MVWFDDRKKIYIIRRRSVSLETPFCRLQCARDAATAEVAKRTNVEEIIKILYSLIEQPSQDLIMPLLCLSFNRIRLEGLLRDLQ
jgi:hypothetical protein